MAQTRLVERWVVVDRAGETSNLYVEDSGIAERLTRFLVESGYRVIGTKRGPGLGAMVEIEDRTRPEAEPETKQEMQ